MSAVTRPLPPTCMGALHSTGIGEVQHLRCEQCGYEEVIAALHLMTDEATTRTPLASLLEQCRAAMLQAEGTLRVLLLQPCVPLRFTEEIEHRAGLLAEAVATLIELRSRLGLPSLAPEPIMPDGETLLLQVVHRQHHASIAYALSQHCHNEREFSV